MLWTDEEKELLQSNLSLEELRERLPHRTERAIVAKRSKLRKNRLRRWTTDEKNKLVEMYNSNATVEEMEKEFERSWAAIRSQAHYLRKRGWKL